MRAHLRALAFEVGGHGPAKFDRAGDAVRQGAVGVVTDDDLAVAAGRDFRFAVTRRRIEIAEGGVERCGAAGQRQAFLAGHGAVGGDHRAVDVAVGAAFLKTLKGLLEDPVRILI